MAWPRINDLRSGGGAPANHLQLAFGSPVAFAALTVEHKFLHYVRALFRGLLHRFPALNMTNGLGIAPHDFQLHGRTPRPSEATLWPSTKGRGSSELLATQELCGRKNAGHGSAQPPRLIWANLSQIGTERDCRHAGKTR